jgi:hypothetical protein
MDNDRYIEMSAYGIDELLEIYASAPVNSEDWMNSYILLLALLPSSSRSPEIQDTLLRGDLRESEMLRVYLRLMTDAEIVALRADFDTDVDMRTVLFDEAYGRFETKGRKTIDIPF